MRIFRKAYFELFPEAKRGFGMTAGRLMLNYGEGRLIGTPQWSNVARTYDHARVYYRLPRAHLEFLLASPVKIRITEFNRPVLGDRVWGVYNSFPNFYRKHLLDVYLLHHDQNRPGGSRGAIETWVRIRSPTTRSASGCRVQPAWVCNTALKPRCRRAR